MGVGPPGRTGREQIARVQAFLAESGRRAGQIIVVGCAHGAGASARALAAEGAAVYPVDCTGNLHTSVIELLLRGGYGGVLVLACPPRDCWNREGPRWLTERVYHDREAELQARVDRARVRIAHAGAGERSRALAALRAFASDIATLDAPAADHGMELDTVCEREEEAVRR
jgi:coenzyme F420-reducing hydrogenase delta subunit